MKAIYQAIIILIISFIIYLFSIVYTLKNKQNFYIINSNKIILKYNTSYKKKLIKFPKIDKLFPESQFRLPNHNAAKAGTVFILENQKILWTKNNQKKYPIASLTKILTTLLVLDKIDKSSNLNLKTKISITSKAKQVAHSSFLKKSPFSSLSLETLLHSILFCSANDSAQLLDDYFTSKNRLPFFAQINQFAQKNKWHSAIFYNAHGLPGKYKNLPNNTINIADLAQVIEKILIRYPIVSKWTREPTHKYFKNTKQIYKANNTNKLTVELPNIIGLKTGFTYQAGYCIVLVWKIQKKTAISILLGCSTKRSRSKLAKEIFLWTNRFLAKRYNIYY